MAAANVGGSTAPHNGSECNFTLKSSQSHLAEVRAGQLFVWALVQLPQIWKRTPNEGLCLRNSSALSYDASSRNDINLFTKFDWVSWRALAIYSLVLELVIIYLNNKYTDLSYIENVSLNENRNINTSFE